MFVNRTYGVAAAALGVLAAGACSDPELNTDLRPDGPPDVVAVLVMTDPVSQLLETATYCRPNDELRPGLVGLPDFTTTTVCPEDGTDPEEVTTAYPDGWYVRIMFDELLDPSIEELTPVLDEATGEPTGASTGSIINAHPVTLQCRSVVNDEFVNVDYDGYYSPSGNRVTWPVGPSLVIKPNDPTTIGTNTECQVTLNDSITDKDGNPVPADQRGPFPFKIAPITAIFADPPVDDPDFESPIDALAVYFDNFYVQFNTTVDPASLCPDDDGDGLCDDDKVFSLKDVDHPNEGPGYCNVSFETCGQLTDCPAGGGDTICGKGFCGISGEVCNTKADCPDPDEHCGTSYVYDYKPFGLTDTEFGLGPVEPIQTEHKYIFQFNEGAVLTDRCGRTTTLGAPSAGDLTLAHFITNAFDFKGTTIVTGEVASAMKRLQFNFNNVLEGQDTASGSTGIPSTAIAGFTISPTPKKLTAACNGTTCPTTDLAAGELLVITQAADGQTMLQGHLQLDTEYTATIPAGTVVKDFYGAEYTFEEALVVKWKTQPNIVMTGISVRNTGAFVGVGNRGVLVKNDSANTTDIRIGFNASIDPTSFDGTELEIVDAATGTPVPGIAVVSASGCGTFPANATGITGACTLRVRGPIPAGDYEITLKAGAQVKDIFGKEYTHAADTTISVTIVDPPAPKQCL